MASSYVEAQLKKLFYFSIVFLLGDPLLVKAFENVEQNLHSRSNKKKDSINHCQKLQSTPVQVQSLSQNMIKDRINHLIR